MSEAIRVLIADDHLIVREGLRLLLEVDPAVMLVGEAVDGVDAVEKACEARPHVVLMDLSMPRLHGIEAIAQLHARLPDTRIVILTNYKDDDLVLRGLRAGACAYLLKDTDRPTLIETIRAAARGETLIGPDLMRRLLAEDRDRASTKTELTERERQVLCAAARGERSREIAQRLSIKERTVKAHLASIYNKLGVDTRAAAVAVAAQRGLLGSLADQDW